MAFQKHALTCPQSSRSVSILSKIRNAFDLPAGFPPEAVEAKK
jgi:hypothetical protein